MAVPAGFESERDLRVLYLAGPGDAVSVLRSMASEKAYESISHVAYSGMVFDVCRRLGCRLLSISTPDKADDFSFGLLRAVNIADPLRGKSGVAYHLGHLSYARTIRRYAREFGANVIIASPQPYPFLFADLALRGVQLVPALHATLAPQFRRPSRAASLMLQLSRRIYSDTSAAILSHPGWTVEQIRTLTRGRTRPIVEFLPLLRGDAFSEVAPPDATASVFRVITVGRVEASKGVFSLIEIARRCREALGDHIHFDICGTGSALNEARERVAKLELQSVMTLHGWTEMSDLLRLWGRSHVAVVPTTVDFTEGFNQVVVEAVLAGRPVITSRVCPSLEYVRPCSIEVDVDDVDGYVSAILGLARDRERYSNLQAATTAVIKPFLDESNSFGAAVAHALRGIASGRPITSVSHPPEF